MFKRSNSVSVHVESFAASEGNTSMAKPSECFLDPKTNVPESPSPTPPQSPSVCQEIKPLSEAEANVYTCPINMEIFVDPVITKEGYTFERHAILKWLETNNTCPLSRGPLTINELIPNKNLKQQIEYFRKIGKLPKTTTPPPLQRCSRAIWTSTGNNSYSDVVNRHEMTISFSNSGGFSEPLGIENPRSSIDVTDRRSVTSTEDEDSIPIVTQERRVIHATYNSELLEPVDIPENPDFSFLSECEKNMIHSAYTTVSRLNKWDYMRRYEPSNQSGFVFDRDPIIDEISGAIESDYGGHSGSSIGYTMRCIQYIAQNGFEKYKENYCRSNN